MLRLNATVTATLAGQIAMGGFMDWHIAPWVRRLATRALAIIPAAAFALIYGTATTAPLLVATQVSRRSSFRSPSSPWFTSLRAAEKWMIS